MGTEYTALSSTISIAGIAFLALWLYRDYRLDLFREKMFCARNRLFDLGRSGDVPFDHPASTMLRASFNGTIQYGHRLGSLNLLFALCLVGRDPQLRTHFASHSRRWAQSLDSLPEPAQSKVRRLRGEMHYLVLEQIIFTSPLLACTLFPLMAWAVLSRIHGAIARIVNAILGDSLRRLLADRMDCFSASIASQNYESSTVAAA